MIARRIIGILIVIAIAIIGTIMYLVLNRKVKDVESDLVIRNKEDIKGK